jgi:hypothetical protein
MHWNVSIGPEKRPIFGRFLTLFSLKRPARCEKNTSNMAVTVGDVMDDVTCKCSMSFVIEPAASALSGYCVAINKGVRVFDES